MAFNAPPAVSLSVLRERFAALGPVSELPGERTFRGRCSTFEGLLEFGQVSADFLRERRAEGSPFWHEGAPELAELLMDAWPARD